MRSKSAGQYRGIDISSWQGNVDFDKVKDSGIDIVYIKVSEGTNYINNYFASSFDDAKAIGLMIGFYHYFHGNIDAVAQANYFVKAIGGRQGQCRLAIDLEVSDGVNSQSLTSNAIAFLQEVERLTGKGTVVYTYTNFARNNIDSRLGKYPLWISNYDVDTPGENPIWSEWIGFQYSSTGSVPGVSGNCDMDVFTDGILLSGSYVPEPKPNPMIPPPFGGNNYYIVQPGDTLSGIAAKFNTNYEVLAQINGISNPNLIYPGEKIILPSGVLDSNITYIVQSGDTLSGIAEEYGTTYQHLAEINGLSNPNLIYPGEVIKIS